MFFYKLSLSPFMDISLGFASFLYLGIIFHPTPKNDVRKKDMPTEFSLSANVTTQHTSDLGRKLMDVRHAGQEQTERDRRKLSGCFIAYVNLSERASVTENCLQKEAGRRFCWYMRCWWERCCCIAA